MHRVSAELERAIEQEFRAVVDAIQVIRRAVVELHQQLAPMPASQVHRNETRRAA
jgi:hypothetical protein